MKTLIMILLLFTWELFSQTEYTSVVAADTADSLGTIIRMNSKEIPVYVETADSLNDYADSAAATTKTLKFYVFTGDTAGYSADTTRLSGWKILTAKDDASTDYSVTIQEGKRTPLNLPIMAAALGKSPTALKSRQVYIIPYITVGVGTQVTLTIGTIPY
jgi:hypothetical protein